MVGTVPGRGGRPHGAAGRLIAVHPPAAAPDENLAVPRWLGGTTLIVLGAASLLFGICNSELVAAMLYAG